MNINKKTKEVYNNECNNNYFREEQKNNLYDRKKQKYKKKAEDVVHKVMNNKCIQNEIYENKIKLQKHIALLELIKYVILYSNTNIKKENTEIIKKREINEINSYQNGNVTNKRYKKGLHKNEVHDIKEEKEK
ncbi:hypothetical protein PFNF54_04482 [Plasmodium falciparum NF54]|uniref:Uncharacterized protein n=1 Tax=Plasmodium falciparum (isolate NF54) TaxID=5843 RepID=W7K1B3_PLAFO|nr:hypothetical protein PFNF54_04482 [Plasmodium falciparum NF54]